MNTRLSLLSTFLVTTALTILPLGIHAQGIVDFCQSTVSGVGLPVTLAVCPAADGEALIDKGAQLIVTVRNINGVPIPNIPWQDIWLIGCENGLVLCGGASSSNADANTDVNGQTTINRTLAVGGSSDGVAVVVQGVVLVFPLNCVDIRCMAVNVRSVDIDGTLTTDVVDLSIFGAAFPPNAYDSRADFDGNGIIGLVDLAFFAQHFQHNCQ